MKKIIPIICLIISSSFFGLTIGKMLDAPSIPLNAAIFLAMTILNIILWVSILMSETSRNLSPSVKPCAIAVDGVFWVGDTVICSDGKERIIKDIRPKTTRTYTCDALIITDDGDFFTESLHSNEFDNNTKILGKINDQ